VSQYIYNRLLQVLDRRSFSRGCRPEGPEGALPVCLYQFVHEPHRVRVLQLPVRARKRIQSWETARWSAGEVLWCARLAPARDAHPIRARSFGKNDIGTMRHCIGLEFRGFSVRFLVGNRSSYGFFRFSPGPPVKYIQGGTLTQVDSTSILTIMWCPSSSARSQRRYRNNNCSLPVVSSIVLCSGPLLAYVMHALIQYLFIRKIWGFYGCDYEECRLLEYYAVWRNILEDGILHVFVFILHLFGTALMLRA
jgi:hypothetical protein